MCDIKNSKMNRIKQVLEEKGIKQVWLAEQLGKSYNMVNSYAQNRRQPSIEDLYKIADLLKVDARDLLTESPNKND
jgi:putative transcriptional regulator